ncbi:MAG: flavodoxin family protein [Roseburia sp.]|nr:flavodoxin family protein [Roseburia sp.]
MRVLLFNGSPHANGCTYTALHEVAKALLWEGIDTEIIQMGNKPIRDCIGCGGCAAKQRCVFDDDNVNEWIELAAKADGFVFGTPVYYAHPSGRVLSLMDRMFYAGGRNFAQKPAAVVTSARRAGTTATLDAIAKHLSINRMPIVSSTYWNMVHGNTPDEVERDAEGIQTMHKLGEHLAWIIKCIQAGKAAGIGPPVFEPILRTNFIR